MITVNTPEELHIVRAALRTYQNTVNRAITANTEKYGEDHAVVIQLRQDKVTIDACIASLKHNTAK